MKARRDPLPRGVYGLLRVGGLIAVLIALAMPAMPAVAAAATSPQAYQKTPICFAHLGASVSPLSTQQTCWKRSTPSAGQASSHGTSFWTILNRISWGLIAILSIRVIAILILSVQHHRHSKQFLRPRAPWAENPLVSVIVPCYNEEPTLANCVRGIVGQTYPNLEVLLVDDGSKDGTWPLAQELARAHGNVRAIHKQNGGKASALRHGIDECQGEIVVCIDADSIFVPDTVEQLMATLDDPSVDAVGGNVRVANRKGILTACQALDYIIGLNSNGRAYSQLGCMQVIPGAIGAFRKTAYNAVGGHSDDTLVEDMDLTIAFAEHGYRVRYNPHALAYTEAPVKLKDFINQRYRWTLGGMQVLRKYRHLFLRRRHPMSLVGLPMHMVSPWINIAVSLLLFNSFAAAVIQGKPSGLLIFLGAMYALQFVMLTYMLKIDRESKRFLFMTGIETIFYIHLLNFVTIRAAINHILRRKAVWHKIPRLGANQLALPQGDNHAAPTATPTRLPFGAIPGELPFDAITTPRMSTPPILAPEFAESDAIG